MPSQGPALASLPCFIWIPFTQFERATPLAWVCLAAAGVTFTVFMFSRSHAVQISHDTSVMNLLYLEISFAFVWQVAVLRLPVEWFSIAGAAVIVVGSVVQMTMQQQAEKRAVSAEDLIQ